MKRIAAAVGVALVLSVSLSAQHQGWTSVQHPADFMVDPTDRPVPGDYDGDGILDFAVAHNVMDEGPAGLTYWFARLSSFGGGMTMGLQWGIPTDILVPGDYDGDHKTDAAVIRKEDDGLIDWYIFPSRPNTANLYIQWGTVDDIPTAADYDGDGRMDIAVLRPSSGIWYVLRSSCEFMCYSVNAPVQTF
jgi:hypothetical protein